MYLRLSVKTNCRIFKELTRAFEDPHAMSHAHQKLAMTHDTPLRLRVRIVGGASRDRTDDLRVANATLSQLSYGPVR